MQLVFGYGNWLRRDDGLGVWLAQMPRDGWTPVTGHQLLPEHAEIIHRADRVVFIDAAIGAPAGEVLCEAIVPCDETDHTHALGSFTHNATPRLLLGVARDLYGNCPPALLISINGADFGHGDGFSAEICARLPAITAEVDRCIEAFARGLAESAIDDDGSQEIDPDEDSPDSAFWSVPWSGKHAERHDA